MKFKFLIWSQLLKIDKKNLIMTYKVKTQLIKAINLYLTFFAWRIMITIIDAMYFFFHNNFILYFKTIEKANIYIFSVDIIALTFFLTFLTKI